MPLTDDWGGVAVEAERDDWGGVAVADTDDWGGVAVDAAPEVVDGVTLPSGVTKAQLDSIAQHGGGVTFNEDGSATATSMEGVPTETAAETGARINAPLISLPKPTGDSIPAGIGRGALNVVESLTTPENIGVALATAGAGALVQKAVAGGFGAHMIGSVPEQAAAVMEAKTPGEAAQRVTETVATAALGALALKHAVGRPGTGGATKAERQAVAVKPEPAVVPELEKSGLPATAQVLRESPEIAREVEKMQEEISAPAEAPTPAAVQKQPGATQPEPQPVAEPLAASDIQVGDVIEAQSHQITGLKHRGQVVSIIGEEIGMVNEDGAPVLVLRKNATKPPSAPEIDPARQTLPGEARPSPVSETPMTYEATKTARDSVPDIGTRPRDSGARQEAGGTNAPESGSAAWASTAEDYILKARNEAEAQEVAPGDFDALGLSESSLLGEHWVEVRNAAERGQEISSDVLDSLADEHVEHLRKFSPNALPKEYQLPAAGRRQRTAKANQRTAITPRLETDIMHRRPVSAREVEIFQIKLPKGYAREGDLYVHRPTEPARPAASPAQAAPETPRPPAVEPSKSSALPENGKGAAVEQANDWTTATLPEISEKPVTGKTPRAEPLGILPPGMPQMMKDVAAAGAAVKRVVSSLKSIPAFHDFRRSILNWSARNQTSSGEIMRVGKEINKAVPDPVRREAITNWIQAEGDAALLASRAKASVLRRRNGYEAALTLTPEEKAVAAKVRQTYDILLNRARANGIEISEIENYVNQIWRRQPLREFAASSNRRLSESIRFAKKRYYDSFFDGEQAGLKPETKDIAKLLPIYINEVNNAISAKQFVAEMSKGTASDGRLLLAPRGGGKVLDADPAVKDKGAVLVFPDRPGAETLDYRPLNQPALHAWKWVAEENGKPVLVQGDLAVHPEAYSHLKNVLGQSALREWWRSPSENPLADIPKATVKFLVDDVQQIGKATMLGFLSPFHQVQEGTHAIGHRVNPFGGIPKIDLTLPAQADAARHGLMLLPDRVSAQQFREGLDGSSRNLVSNLAGKIPGVGVKIKEWADGYQNYLFHEYIPGLKLKTYDHILDRNQKRYVDELARGDVSLDQIKYLSAQQANAAYGHLNYADIGRNPTIQHLLQIGFLAPDFLEARGRFAGQAARGTISKVGHEQLAAIATLAATQYVFARILNQTLDDDPHWDHPFDVIVGNRRYTMRSVPEDIYKATKDTRRFFSGRLSPLIGRGALEGLSGVNYRGEPTDAAETFTNILAGMVPLTIQPATRGLSETARDNPVSPFEQLLGSMGLHVSRFSPVSEIYHLSKEWTEKHGKEYGLEKRRAVFPVSKYQQLRYALEDSDSERASEEVTRLMGEEKVSRDELGKRLKMSLNHPFTGSKETDEIFKKSLDARGRKIFDAAIKRRKLLMLRFEAL